MTTFPQSVSGDRYVLLIEGADPGDALLRVLGPVSVQQARVSELSFASAGGRFHARLAIEGVDTRRAEHLAHRLAQLPFVGSVAFGWRGGEGPPAPA